MPMHRRVAWFPLLLLPVLAGLFGGSGAVAKGDRLDAQRTLFLATEEALDAGDRQAFREGLERLEDYPLHSWLQYADLRSRLDQARADAVHAFLDAHGETPHGQRLRRAWFDRLAGEERWDELVREFDADTRSTTRLCQYKHALLKLGRREEALAGVDEIWLHGRSQPDACDPVFDAWREAGRLSPELVWGRFQLALEAGQSGLAGYLKRFLPEAERSRADRWLRLYRRPARLSRVSWDAHADERTPEMLETAWRRLARREPEEALTLWQRDDAGRRLAAAQRRDVERTLALRLILERGGESLAYLDTLPESVFDAELREWRVRAALAAGDWGRVLRAVEAMDARQRDDKAWRYWRARALAELGRDEEAERLFSDLAGERNFYGFLAADRAEQPYRIGHRSLDASAEAIRVLARRPAFQRAKEWHALGRFINARREWVRAIAGLNRAGLKAAALLAHRWGWHDRAIFTVAKAREFADVKLRFPLAHAELIRDNAATQGIDPAWALAVARQESAFMEDVRSPAGALGLMQVMPATGRRVARQMEGVQVRHWLDLVKPEVNVPIGTYYLRHNLDRFGGHPLLSTAAYNAGAHRVEEWLPETGRMDADVWAELIPYGETRNYVRRVLAYRVIYETRLGRTPTPLSSLLPPVTARPELEAARMAHNRHWDSDKGERVAYKQACGAPGIEETPCS